MLNVNHSSLPSKSFELESYRLSLILKSLTETRGGQVICSCKRLPVAPLVRERSAKRKVLIIFQAPVALDRKVTRVFDSRDMRATTYFALDFVALGYIMNFMAFEALEVRNVLVDLE